MATIKPKTTSEPKLSQRREPTQARAQQTIQTLFKAAAQILDKEGEAGLTTNKVAAAAGFSIGTLYQYFPSKEMLVRAMAARGQDLVLQELEGYLSALETRADVQQMDGRELLGKAIHILLHGFAKGKGLSQTLIRLGWTLEKPDETANAVRQVADRLAIFFERIAHPALQLPSTAQMFVLTRSVIGTLRSASLEKSPLLGSPAFEDALTQMAWALLARPAQAAGLALGARPIR
ncbi:TetR/AcrR family transcriptional regulator [Limnohabitans sp. T6-20]|uniref:TetR/AcrR family transcriptional regulator n=1 Tax=Limnohabitans sp. T6-20 TaxID=1100725 RepID=UPI000D3B2E69|nr:TetR/AcrR family transcriptional regulator [Limnohabitans sp. T6-20]